MTSRNNGTNTDGRNSDGTFAEGNPGRPKGARHKITRAVEDLLEELQSRLDIFNGHTHVVDVINRADFAQFNPVSYWSAPFPSPYVPTPVAMCPLSHAWERVRVRAVASVKIGLRKAFHPHPSLLPCAEEGISSLRIKL